MRKKFRSKDIFDDLEPKEKTPIIPIIIFVSIVIILGVVTMVIVNLLAHHPDVDVPWIDLGNNTEEPGKVTSSRDQMKLVVPTLNDNLNSIGVLDAELSFTKVKADNKGFVITASLLNTRGSFTTIEVKHVLIDGFYTTTTFAISDALDTDEYGSVWGVEQKPTEVEFRIKKTELDDLDIFGFNRIDIVYDAENETDKEVNSSFGIVAHNDLDIVNDRTGLIKIDEKNDIVISYYKTIAADDATYIYFDFVNQGRIKKDVTIYVKQLLINNKVYDMTDFSGLIPRGAQRALYLKIPKKDISRVSTLKVQFFIVEEDEKTKEKSFYITNEYSRAY